MITPMSRRQHLYDALSLELKPETLIVDDESNQHHVPQGAETHFKITAVSSRFEQLNRIERHRMVNAFLKTELANGLHALSLHLYTPAEWLQKTKPILPSPNCRDGYRHGTKNNE